MASLAKKASRYQRIIERVFGNSYASGSTVVDFSREDLLKAATDLQLTIPKNIGDVVYSFRYRRALPESIVKTCGDGETWYIFGTGDASYRFKRGPIVHLAPTKDLFQIKILDSTPEIISRYAQNDEQAALAKVRYNRIIDLFTGVTAYSLQSHLRTKVDSVGQIEIDELYVGMNKRGHHFVLPVQAKGKSDRLGVVQIYQDLAFCAAVFPGIQVRPIGVQSMKDGALALFEYSIQDDLVRKVEERHYRLVSDAELSSDDLIEIRGRE